MSRRHLPCLSLLLALSGCSTFPPLQSRNENAEPQLPWIRGQGFDLRKLHDKAYFCFGQKNRDEPMTNA